MNFPRPWESYFETDIPVNRSELDSVTINEYNHYVSVIGGLELRNKANYEDNKESQVRALLLELLGRLRLVPSNSWGLSVSQCFTPRLRFLIRCDSGTSIPFHLVIQTDSEDLMYTPRSDFHMCIHNIPHLLLEVHSQPNEGDHFRMLLQAACISRIGSWLRAPTSGNSIVIMAIYIDKLFRAHQHFLCQPDILSTEVSVQLFGRIAMAYVIFSRSNTLPTFSI